MDTEDALINIANTIYSLLSKEKEVKSEEELFSDKVYIDIIDTLLQNIQGEITPGKTPEEKIENIGLLLSLLNKLFETEFDIDPRKIVIEKDKESAKNLLELLLEVTTTFINSGAEFEEEEDEFEERKMNISDPGQKFNEESVESLRLGKDKKSGKKSEKKEKKMKKEENIDIKGLDKEKSQSGENLIFERDNNKDNLLDNNIDINNDKEEKKNNSDVDDEIIKKNTEEENINLTNENDNEINSEKKTYDIPGLLEGDIEKSKSKSKSNIELDNDNDNDLEEEEFNIQKNKFNLGNLNNSDDDNSSINNKLANSVPQPMDKPMLTNNNSSEDYIDLRKNQKSKEKKDEDDFDYNYNEELEEKEEKNNSISNSNTSNMNISLHSKKSKSKKNNQKIIDESNSKYNNNDSSNKKSNTKNKNKVNNINNNNNNTGTNSKNNNINNKNSINKKSAKKQTHTTSKKNLTEIQSNISLNDDISKSSVYTNSLRPAPNPNEKKAEKKNEENSRKSSIKTKSKSSASTIINSEIPLNTEGFKYELIKELKKLYGKKIGKVLQGPNNSYSNLDLVLQEFKLAKKQEKIMKNAEKNSASKSNAYLSSEEPILTKDFLLKNERLLQLMLQICDQKLKNKKNEQKKYVREIGQNLPFMKKLKDYESKRLENEIANKKFFYKNNNNYLEEIYFCRKIYENFYQLEVEKCAREIESLNLINAMKLEEKANSISETENYYKNKIAILNEIGRREREENKRNKMEEEYIYYQLNSMSKKELKKKIKMILNSIDDDNIINNEEGENTNTNNNNNMQNNQQEIEKILDNYK